MLEYYQNFIQKLKQKKPKEQMSLKFVQELFEMEDLNKWLKFNAMTEEQVQRIRKFENGMEELEIILYVPDYQSENV